MYLSENDAVLISVCEPLNYIHQDTKSARLIAVCKRSITLNKFGKRVRGCCVHVFLVIVIIHLAMKLYLSGLDEKSASAEISPLLAYYQ